MINIIWKDLQFFSICHLVDYAIMVVILAQAYFKTAFNNRSIVREIISKSGAGTLVVKSKDYIFQIFICFWVPS